MTKTIPVAEAVGMVLPHDVTEIRQNEFKGRAFKKGHIIKEEDIERLQRLGKEHIYVLSLAADDIHENEAAQLMAAALHGTGTTISGEPVEGKLNILAACDGLLKIDTDALYQFNLLADVMCATLHNNTPVTQGRQIAATRLIPLIGSRKLVNQAVVIAQQAQGIIQIIMPKKARAGLVITGNEVFHGRIKDAFEQVLRKKLVKIGSDVIEVRFAPDDAGVIASEIKNCLKAGADLIITSGGMSVDPDDVTRQGIARAGAIDIVYGTPVLPGAMFLLGYIDQVPIMGLPACGMFHNITIFDLLLPRILAGEKINREILAKMGHGGLCSNCPTCSYPLCGFGK